MLNGLYKFTYLLTYLLFTYLSSCLCGGCSGERLAFGHYYLRPHETFHEPTRRFFHCELFRVPLYDLVPLDAIVGLCCIMDLHTYCRVSLLIVCGQRTNTLG